MTRAPDNLLAARTLLLDCLGPHGLQRDAVGIVGDANHRGGYHCGSDRVVDRDYSVVESSRDSSGLTDHASGLDVGKFSVRSGGATHTLQTLSTWCVEQCVAGAADTKDIREIIYSPDGKTVKRWDRLGIRKTGDSSHLIHTHFSFFRDAIKAGRDQTPLFRRYLTTIGLLKAPSLEDDMALSAEDRAALAALHADVRKILTGNLTVGTSGAPENALLYWVRSIADAQDPTVRKAYPTWVPSGPGLKQLAEQVAQLRGQVETLAKQQPAAGELDYDRLAQALLRQMIAGGK
ncbi:hypothetical protein AB0C02_28190 [Micromonospora sp. NPDC048999]|uniref:hypothetical protein n=1 Tax=Micromonospora sp. NPDC048999 TaxID=3155391 RepID=UPI0033CF8665